MKIYPLIIKQTKAGKKRFHLPTLLTSIFLISLLLSSLGIQVASAIDEEFYSGNDILFWDPDACSNAAGVGNGSLIGNENAEKIWNFLTGADGNLPAGETLTAEQAAGVMGNLRQESGANFDPGAEQKGGGGGFGIAQWTGGRRGQLEEAARKKGVPVNDLAFQLRYLYEEAKARPAKGGGGNEWKVLKDKVSIEDALVFWHDSFERSADSREAVIDTRGGYAHDVFNSFAGKAPAASTAGGSTQSASGGGSTVFLDPGHGGAIPEYTDPQSGFVITENPNSPEREDVLDVANRVRTELEKSNYRVLMSRSANDQAVKFRDRSNAAEAAKADIAVSIHTTPGEINQAWPQRVGTYREYKGKRETFNNAKTAQTSESYANIFTQTRKDAEGHEVTTDPGNTTQANSFNRKEITTKGNISLVQLWAPNVPWVYNEIAQDQGTAISEARKAAYTKGIVEAIKKAVPATGKGACGGFSGGNLAETTLAYAWPQYKGLDIVPKPEWAEAVKKAQSQGLYVGGTKYPGIDCGGFVTRLLIDSGFEPNYNHAGKGGNTVTQKEWAEANWQKVGDGSSINVADLRPGDVAFQPGHTFAYVGTIPGFESDIASASLDERAPMAGKEDPRGGDVTWFRKK